MAKKKTVEVNDKNVANNLIRTQLQKNPTLFETWRGGPYWNSNIEFKSFIDAIMHLLFLGVTKSSKNLLDIAIKKSSMNAADCSKRQKLYKIITN